MEPLAEAYRVLDLELNASRQDIEEAYRHLAKVWHPDRFMNDEKLRKVAEQKIKAINKAYEDLTEWGRGTNNASEEATEAGPSADEPREVHVPSTRTVERKAAPNPSYEFDSRKVRFSPEAPWNHKIGRLLGMLAVVLIVVGSVLYYVGLVWYENPGHFPALIILLSAFPLFAASHVFGVPKKANQTKKQRVRGNRKRG